MQHFSYKFRSFRFHHHHHHHHHQGFNQPPSTDVRRWHNSQIVKLDIIYISFISSPHIRFLQIKAFRVTTSNSGNFRVICNIFLTNFVPSASNQIRHHIYIYIIHIKSSYEIPPDQGFHGHYTSNSGNFRVICNISPTNFIPSASSHIRHQIYIIRIKSSYQIPPDQGFEGHYFKLRELQGTMQHFSYKFRSFRFQSN